jgi:hypothetical protein
MLFYSSISPEVFICDECVNESHELLGDRERELGPECGPEKCREPNCNRLRIRLAVFCLKHQFDGSWSKTRNLVAKNEA